MKKLILLSIISLFVASCSNGIAKYESSLTTEIGKEPNTNKQNGNDKNTQIIEWKGVSLTLQSNLKNVVDKTFGSLPAKTSELTADIDREGNTIKGTFVRYWSYENSKSKVELSYQFEDAKPNTMNVKLFITTK